MMYGKKMPAGKTAAKPAEKARPMPKRGMRTATNQMNKAKHSKAK
jgi:hypothetical protein